MTRTDFLLDADIIKTTRKFVCKYKCRYYTRWIDTLSKKTSFSLVSSEKKKNIKNVQTFLLSIKFLYTRNNKSNTKILKHRCDILLKYNLFYKKKCIIN
ncbi:hypothetical protein PUN28_018827 [Cardiocondyla obscurior]|uniref:Uncharacterized protein n=1 Tax=Cardiocondyla obscurior TaxID=286306 RepID=A0AAW2EC86_9HYME